MSQINEAIDGVEQLLEFARNKTGAGYHDGRVWAESEVVAYQNVLNLLSHIASQGDPEGKKKYPYPDQLDSYRWK